MHSRKKSSLTGNTTHIHTFDSNIYFILFDTTIVYTPSFIAPQTPKIASYSANLPLPAHDTQNSDIAT